MKRLSTKEIFSEFDTMAKIVEEVLEDLVILKEGNADVVEKICLATEVHTTQTIEAVAANTSELIIMKMDIKTTLWFESLVSKAGDVDWRIVKLNIDILNQQRIK
ncbi:uncharacterized protein KRP23_9672 [Phytophthora ramorum]|uniref:uncharacterized protein n=1 Tax=Phytophthora ramorum TaxID=164328 RepID=UPI00309968C6|nr:hypothetical protein KRP23_9672 [Phytophthora ramorum]